ncbi:MAG: ABC transporter substrate-binding protein [Deltaproteobacteria bacterium]|nr:ABC transporter substrate-binding protein [Deltaproteobacteria bacterium]
MKGFLRVLFVSALGFCFALGFSTGATCGEEPLKIGYVGAVTWDYGKTQIAAAKLAIEEVNKGGGILGRPLKLYIADSGLKASGAANAVHKLVEVDDVKFLIGCFGSEETMAARETACDLKVVSIFSGGATHDWVTSTDKNYEKYKYAFRNSPHDELDGEARYVIEEQVPFIAEQIKSELGIDKIKLAVLSDAAQWTELVHEACLNEFKEKGYEIVYESKLSTSATDASVELTAIKKSGAHIIVGTMAYKSSLPLIRQWHEMKVPAIWAGVNVLAMSPKFWEQTGGKCAYVCTYNFGAAHVPVTADTKKLWDYLQKEVGTCYFNSAGTYVAIWSLKHAADKAKSLEDDAMISALEDIKFESVGGTIDYQQNHTFRYGPVGVGSPMWTLQHQPGGKFVMVHIGPIEPKEKQDKYVDGKLLLPPWMFKK